jgi:hypothetical protein
MKKYVGLLIIVLMLPLMSRGPAYAFTAILTDDIYYASDGLTFNTQELRIGNDMTSVYTSYVTYLGFKLPEVNDGGNFDFRLGVYFRGGSSTGSSCAGVYVVADDALSNPQPIDAYAPVDSLYSSPSKPLAIQELNPANPGWVYFDFTITPDSPYYKGLFDGTMVLAMAVPFDFKTDAQYVFSSMDGPYAPRMEYADPSAVPEPSTLFLFGVGLIGIAIMYAKRVSPVKAKQLS